MVGGGIPLLCFLLLMVYFFVEIGRYQRGPVHLQYNVFGAKAFSLHHRHEQPGQKDEARKRAFRLHHRHEQPGQKDEARKKASMASLSFLFFFPLWKDL